MKRWIRPQGVIIFILLLVLFAVLVLVLSGPILGRGIERAGTAVVGARVDVDSARLSLFPLGLTVTGLDVTNPRAPMENTVSVGRIAFNMDPGALIRRKLLVEEMAVEGMAFNTPRAVSGAVKESVPAEDPTEEPFRLEPLKIPPVSQILAQEDLTSVRHSEAVRKKAGEIEENIKAAREGLPDRVKATDYRARLEKLFSGAGLDPARLNEAKKLRDEIRDERDRIRTVEDGITGGLSDLRNQLKEARESVSEDVNRLKEKYALTPGGLSNLSGLLFGPEVHKWTERTAQALKLLSHLPSGEEKDPKEVRPPRGKGIDIPLKERRPLPGFLIKRAALSLEVASGAIEGEALDLASDQSFQNNPATFSLAGRDLPGGAFLGARGVLDRTDPSAPRDNLKVTYKGWNVTDLTLSESDVFPVSLRRGSGTLSGEVVLKGLVMEGSVKVDLSSASLEAGGTQTSALGRAMQQALQGVGSVSLTAVVNGTLDDPKVHLSSDLDRILKEAVGQAASEESARLEAALRKSIEGRTGPAIAEATGSLKHLEDAKEEVRAIKAELEKALKVKGKLPF